ncbi:MAG: type I-U CRISPR-associated protein Csb2 [Thermaerobacter sp.]|nr:type I-U CRISPR-associated protein Csb2 [Thermaerobacter sp.]
MLTLAIAFTDGRYHPSPWTSGAEAALFEWPPAPWRLMRALVHAAEQAGVVDDVWPWLQRLREAPLYHLPQASVGYVPTRSPQEYAGFVALDPTQATIYASWPTLSLMKTQERALATLLSRVTYLGRSDTRTALSIAPGPPADVSLLACGTAPGPLPCDEVSLLAAGSDADPTSLHARRPEDGLPHTAILARYYRPKAAISGRLPSDLPSSPLLELFRYRVTGSLPLDAGYAFAEQARRASMARYGRQNGGAVSAVFSGKDPVTGTPSPQHRHAHFLPTDEDGDGFIDHLTVYTAAGMGKLEVSALEELRVIYPGPGLSARVRLKRASDAAPPALLGPAANWVSHLPFAPIRHAKTVRGHQQDSPTDQILLELSRRGLPAPKDVRLLRVDAAAEVFRKVSGAHLSPGPRHFAEIAFPQLVSGPIAIGAACHFGMGLFLPSDHARGGRNAPA